MKRTGKIFLLNQNINHIWLLVLIILLGWLILTSNHLYAQASAQFKLGDKVSIYSDKAFRKNQGKFFEAIGNVVIISEKDTIYGEIASFDQEKMEVKVEGNVRVINQDLSIYGSEIIYDLNTGFAQVTNARVTSGNFVIVAKMLKRLSPILYEAEHAEFSSCKDCPESWAIFGTKIKLKMGSYVEIINGMARLKGIDVLYIPYIVLPIQTKRKTGLLFPRISSRLGEGISYEQPVFWAINDQQDATISPTFWAKRGYGGDVEYRHKFSEKSWLRTENRLLSDTIYQPGLRGSNQSGTETFRYFSEIENHYQPSPDLTAHFRYTSTRDLDIVRDHPIYIDQKILSPDIGFDGFTDYRTDWLSLGVSSEYKRNQLVSDPLEFDRNYVQIVPRFNFSSTPIKIIQTDLPLLRHMVMGIDGHVTRYRQVGENEDDYLRNADRLSTKPYLFWNILTYGPFALNSRYTFDTQEYRFEDPKQNRFGKNASMFKTEFSFTMDRIFGLAYEKRVPIKEEETSINAHGLGENTIGAVPDFEKSSGKEYIELPQASYRHAQDFKFIHHYISSDNVYGNPRFREQIGASRGWFDYEDAIRADEYLLGGNMTRTTIAPSNTVELQWNNVLIKKTSKKFNFWEDQKYLSDNFNYRQMAYFNISQGYILDDRTKSLTFNEKLTPLGVQTGYAAETWNINLSEYFFHSTYAHVFNANGQKKFDLLYLLGSYNLISLTNSKIKTAQYGGQVRPVDSLGFAMLKEIDLEAKQTIRDIYTIDYMPSNNCWILSFNYRKSLVDSRFAFNIIFEFSDQNFATYRNDYFALRRFEM